MDSYIKGITLERCCLYGNCLIRKSASLDYAELVMLECNKEVEKLHRIEKKNYLRDKIIFLRASLCIALSFLALPCVALRCLALPYATLRHLEFLLYCLELPCIALRHLSSPLITLHFF